MKEINVYDLEQLADGVPPDRVSNDWDSAYVIETLSRWILSVLGKATIGEIKDAMEREEDEAVLSE